MSDSIQLTMIPLSLPLNDNSIEVAADLFAVQRARDELAACSVSRSSEPRSERLRPEYSEEVRTRQVETILARLAPIERAIMATPARTIAGLGVKARHAAYAMSQYWEEPVDQIDWEAKAVRRLVEAVCEVGRMPLPFWQLKSRRIVASRTSCFKSPQRKERSE